MGGKINDFFENDTALSGNNSILYNSNNCNVNSLGNSYSNKYNKGGIKNDNSKSR